MAAFESGAHDEEDEHRAMELRKRLRSTKANAAAHLSDDEPAGSHAESKSSIMDLSELNSPYRAPVGLNSGRKRVKTPVRLIVSALQLRTSSSGLKGDLRDTFAAVSLRVIAIATLVVVIVVVVVVVDDAVPALVCHLGCARSYCNASFVFADHSAVPLSTQQGTGQCCPREAV